MLKNTLIDFGNMSSPVILRVGDSDDEEKVDQLQNIPTIQFIDRLDQQIYELLKARFAGRNLTDLDLRDSVKSFYANNPKETYGNWVYYPWKNKVIRLLPEEDFIFVRTQRNNYKIAPAEQQFLKEKKIGIIGLSVGQSIALAMALERSCGEMRLADFDTLELSNLNRIKAGVLDLGEAKIDIAAREIAEIDPYLKLTFFREGINQDNIEDFLTEGGELDLLIDECDSLDIKILAREKARAHRIPVLMETSDRGMLDVERFDLEPERAILHGAMGDISHRDLQNLTQTQKVAIGLKITGVNTISPRMKSSLLEINQTISSWPQLASAVFLGGASVAHVGRKLLLGDLIESGRYYVDLDEIVKIKKVSEHPISNSQEKGKIDFSKFLPKSELRSSYAISQKEVGELIQKANMAPSGGNCQPWQWILDRKNVLHLIHDKSKSISLLDYRGTGSLIAFGAALENLRLASAEMGIKITIINQIQAFDQELIASITFDSKNPEPIQVSHLDLAKGISLRTTNRKNGERIEIPSKLILQYKGIAEELGLRLESITELEQLKELAEVIGGMDRLRFFHNQGFSDFVSEIRWNPEDAKNSGDGIDIETLELSKTDRLVMGLVKDPETISFFRKFDLGYGLAKISDQTLLSASAVLMIQADQFNAKSYLNSGAALQRIWIKANMDGFAFQPISASLFIFHLVAREDDSGYSESEKENILDLKKKLNQLFNKNLDKTEIFMFRLNVASDPSIRSYRRDIKESLTIL